MVPNPKKGMTLFELLLASIVFAMIGGAVLLVFQVVMRETRFHSSVSEAVKNNSLALHKMANEISTARTLYCPDDLALADLQTNDESIEAGYKPLSLERCLSFNIKTSSGENRVIGYYLDGTSGQIKRAVFDTGADKNPSSWRIYNPAGQISAVAHVLPEDRFAYRRFAFKFDKAYRDIEGHAPNIHPTQILDISVIIDRVENGKTAGYYPMSTKVWLERNSGIYPSY